MKLSKTQNLSTAEDRKRMKVIPYASAIGSIKYAMWIVVFDLRKGSGIHRKGFRMFPEMFGHENTLSGPKGKAHKAFGKCKRKFCGD